MNDVRNIFARHGLRCTAQRRAIYDALCRSKAHPTAETLYRQVQGMTDSVSLATVYNTLEVLNDAGLVRKIPSSSGCCRYDANVGEHLHLCIAGTSEIRDVPADLSREVLSSIPRSLLQRIERATGSRIESMNVQFIARNDGHKRPRTTDDAR